MQSQSPFRTPEWRQALDIHRHSLLPLPSSIVLARRTIDSRLLIFSQLAQIWTPIRPRSPSMGEKEFPRGSSMTVLWVSICKKDVDFLFFSACRRKSAGLWPSGVEKNSSPAPALIVTSSQTGGSCARSTSLFLHGIANNIGSSRAL